MAKPTTTPSKSSKDASTKTATQSQGVTSSVKSAVVPSDENRVVRFLREVRAEMAKMTWPSRHELLQSTIVVLIAVAIAAAYVGLLDLVFANLVQLLPF